MNNSSLGIEIYNNKNSKYSKTNYLKSQKLVSKIFSLSNFEMINFWNF